MKELVKVYRLNFDNDLEKKTLITVGIEVKKVETKDEFAVIQDLLEKLLSPLILSVLTQVTIISGKNELLQEVKKETPKVRSSKEDLPRPNTKEKAIPADVPIEKPKTKSSKAIKMEDLDEGNTDIKFSYDHKVLISEIPDVPESIGSNNSETPDVPESIGSNNSETPDVPESIDSDNDDNEW